MLWLVSGAEAHVRIEALRLDDASFVARYAVPAVANAIFEVATFAGGVRVIVARDRDWALYALEAPCCSLGAPIATQRAMRRLVPSLRGGVLLVLAIAMSACEAEDRVTLRIDGGPPPAVPDASCEPVPCRPTGFVCRSGQVVELETLASPCERPMLQCAELGVVRRCERGCVEGAMSGIAETLCEETRPKVPGDRCTSDAECMPSGFELACAVERGVCIERLPEACNGMDDDRNGTVDEGCACVPRTLARMPAVGTATAIAFAPDRIGVLTDRRADLLDANGAIVATFRDLVDARQIAFVGGEMVVVLQQGTTGVSTLVRLRDDGTSTRVVLRGTAPGTQTWIVDDGEGWVLFTPISGTSLGITRHAPTGERIARNQLGGILGVRFVVRHGDRVFLAVDGGVGLAVLGPALSLDPLPVPAADSFVPVDAAIDGDTVAFLTTTPDSRPAIARARPDGTLSARQELVDAQPILWPVWLGIERTGGRIAVASTHGAEVLVQVARSDDGTRIGDTVIPWEIRRFGIGDPGTGLRIVVARDDVWEVIDPCPLPDPEPTP